MDYDSVAHAVVLFGGFSVSPIQGDTWKLSVAPWGPRNRGLGVAQATREFRGWFFEKSILARTALNAAPFEMAYDPSQGVLIYGGLDLNDSVILSDMLLLTPWGHARNAFPMAMLACGIISGVTTITASTDTISDSVSEGKG
jgi:hypothetical protein